MDPSAYAVSLVYVVTLVTTKSFTCSPSWDASGLSSYLLSILHHSPFLFLHMYQDANFKKGVTKYFMLFTPEKVHPSY